MPAKWMVLCHGVPLVVGTVHFKACSTQFHIAPHLFSKPCSLVFVYAFSLPSFHHFFNQSSCVITWTCFLFYPDCFMYLSLSPSPCSLQSICSVLRNSSSIPSLLFPSRYSRFWNYLWCPVILIAWNCLPVCLLAALVSCPPPYT